VLDLPSKMVTGRRETDFLKIMENCQILLANKQKNCIFLKNFKCKHAFFGAYQKDHSETFLTMSYLSILLIVVRELFLARNNRAKKPIYRLLRTYKAG